MDGKGIVAQRLHRAPERLTQQSDQPAATPDYGSSLLGRLSESQHRRRVRIQLILTVFVVVADLIGIGVAVLIIIVAIPVPNILASDVRWIAAAVAPLYVVVADLVGGAWITRLIIGSLRWAIEETPPTMLDQRNTFAAPRRLTFIELVLWGVGAVLLTALYGLVDTAYIPKMLLGIGFGGIWACASCYFFAEFALWPFAAQALEAGKPQGWSGPGIMRRTTTAWLAGSGVPMIGIGLAATFTLTQRNMTLGQFGIAVLILAVAAFALGFILILMAAWMTATPIQVVRAGLQRVEDGDLDINLLVFDGSELGELQRGFNSMVQRLRERERELAELNASLEARVEQRTAQLAAANERLRQDAAVREAMREQLVAREKLAGLGTFTAGVAHHIRNPLNFITNFADVITRCSTDILESAPDFEDLEENVGSLIDAANRVVANSKRIDDVVAKMEQLIDRSSLPSSPIDVAHVVEEVTRELVDAVGEAKPRLAVRSTGEVTAVADAEQIARVVTAIVSNACEATATGPHGGCIEIEFSSSGTNAVFAISDNGVGMNRETLERVFDPFFTTKKGASGTGLGLAVAYDIVVGIHGGTISAESEPGAGTTFTVTIPERPAATEVIEALGPAVNDVP